MSLSVAQGFKYGLMGLPLAFVALPLYVMLPNHYAREFGLSLAWLGAVLLGARLFDAVIDPLLGRLSDHLLARSRQAVLRMGAVASVVLLIAFTLLFFPPVRSGPALLVWATALLLLTYSAYSMLNITHQAWGAMLGNTPLTANNQFKMPGLITPEQAAVDIIRGWERGEFEIHFPKRFTCWMKLLRLLPYRLYFPVVRRLTGL